MLSAPYIPGIPRRWGVQISSMLARDGLRKHAEKLDIVHRAQNDIVPLPLDADEGAIHCAAERAVRECYSYADRYQLATLIIDGIALLCQRMGVPCPTGVTEREVIARAVDKAWWMRQLRKAHKRNFEHMAIRLEFTSRHAGPYICDESAARQAAENRENAKMLERTEVQNEHGQRYTLADLAALGVANKEVRRGELMTRIRGFEEIATDLNHVAMFWTITAPSKYHGVISETGKANPKYVAFGSPTPRDAQRYLADVWKCVRSALHRRGIRPYGLRIAEPHHDGCPHWHMMLFVEPGQAADMEKIIRKYALAEDADEAGAKQNRVKLVRIEAHRGTASGYIVKYICKNVDGNGVGDHKTLDGYTVRTNDLFGGEEITPSQRVTYWSQLWGIRQFQQIGGAPVGVWRELRRIAEETVRNAPADLRAAHVAVQSIKATEVNIVDGKPVETVKTIKQASWADYLRAMGGPCVGRGGNIKLAKRETKIEGKYATYQEEKPCGVYHKTNANAVYESVRYQWVRVALVEAVAVPRTGVNNCTDGQPTEGRIQFEMDGEAAKKIKIRSATVVDWGGIKRRAREIEKETKKFVWRRNKRD